MKSRIELLESWRVRLEQMDPYSEDNEDNEEIGGDDEVLQGPPKKKRRLTVDLEDMSF